MNQVNGHSVPPGKSIIERLHAMADEYYMKWMSCPEGEGEIWQGRIEGVCDSVGLMTNTKPDLQWDSVEARYEDRKRRGAK